VLIGTATATDNCTATASIVITNDVLLLFLGNTTVTWKDTDAAGGVFYLHTNGNCKRYQQSPVITCPAASVIELILLVLTEVLDLATATDIVPLQLHCHNQ
jgi:hypothetical protein